LSGYNGKTTEDRPTVSAREL